MLTKYDIKIVNPWQPRDYLMITAHLPRASPSGSGRLSMIIPRYYGLTTRKWFPLWGERAHVFLLYSALNPLIQPSPHFISTFLCFPRSSQALILTPYLSRLLYFSWSSVSEDLIFSSCIFFAPPCSTFFLLEIVLSNRAWSLSKD